jgi:ABC-type transporter Mla subunit MlaD
MKPLTTAIIGALVVAVAVVGYLYYQRTSNDITIQMPKVELKN